MLALVHLFRCDQRSAQGMFGLLSQWSFGESAYGHKCTHVHTGECSRKYEHALVPFGTYRKDYHLIKLSLQKKESELLGI